MIASPPAVQPARPPDGGNRRRLVAGLMLALVLALHAMLFGVVPVGWGGDRDDAPRLVLQTRQIVVSPLAPRAPPPAVEPRVAAQPPRERPALRTAPEPAPAASAPTQAQPPAVSAFQAVEPEPAQAVAQAPPEPSPSAGSGQASAEARDVVSGAAAGGVGAQAGEPVPVYATRLPPATHLDYELRRGLLAGSGTLDWRPTPPGYQMNLEGNAFGLSVLSWASRGALDAHGIAPERFTDRRRNRSEQAANFRREDGFISYSGPPVEVRLPPGAQDRLSWMVQLPAILEANPALREPGQRIVLFVTGARGDADVWTFVVQGRETLSLPAGPVPDAIHLLRAPRKAYDTRAEAWLDPARGHLPVRARIGSAEGADSTELLLAR